ncbi:GyrI-like domain-containing protein [Actinomadura roseirufa]|uniref:GyrI-like domain-containing protein n=1 Tax=Actinomadura roseirufa TaxID=2094049 RepID=UPI0010412A24|nr:effector binding domain-containing protein [Actinomadura roseirufa]
MELVEREEILVVGRAVRTTNEAEADPSRGLLAGLWARAGAPGAFDHVGSRKDARLYAVLTDYESDHHGAYTQIVGVAVSDLADLPEGLVVVRVPAARCLRLEARGPMPGALIDAWQVAWDHTDPPRAFTTDLEIHGPDGADLLLAVR